MWLGIILLGYFIGVWLLLRFFQAVHQWDDQIEAMEYQRQDKTKRKAADYRPAS
jgi:hypothetical protein